MLLDIKTKYEDYKYIQDDLTELTNENIELIAAKNDWAAFQILLKCDEDFTLSLGSNPFFSPKGNISNIRLDAQINNLKCNIIMQPEGLVKDDDGKLKADILLNDDNVNVEKNKYMPIWIEIHIPEDATQGDYNGIIRILNHNMFEDEKELMKISFNLKVYDVVMPESSKYSFHLDLWQHVSNISRKHETVLFSDEHFKILEGYVKTLADLGQKAVTVIASEIPWSGQRCFRTHDYLSDLYEYNMIRVTKDKKGNYMYNYEIVDRYIELCEKYGINGEIEVFGLTNIWVDEEYGFGGVADFPDAIRIRYFDESDRVYIYMKSKNEIIEYIKALENHFIEKGLIGKVRIVADEPSDIELYKIRIELIKNAAPSFKFKTAINHSEFIKEFKDVVSDYVPILDCVCLEWDTLNTLRKDIKGKLSWYVCCWPLRPNTFICSPLIESRFIGIFTAYMELDGFLRWNYTAWPEKPRERISYRYPDWRAGDTNFVYPSNGGSPLLTLRYKNLKRGIEDFELIQQLKNNTEKANEVLETLWDIILKEKDVENFNPAYNKKAEELYSLDYKDYLSFRKILFTELARK